MKYRYELTDLLVVGSGVAGLVTALAATSRSVLLATKSSLSSGASPRAQGGIAAAVGPSDSPAKHARDTLRAARGLAEPAVVSKVTERAPATIAKLLELGVIFDRSQSGELSLGREGGHESPRIVHADGDATGAAIVRSLVRAVREASHVRCFEGLFIVDLLTHAGRIVGAEGVDDAGARVVVLARDVVLATGGFGQAFRYTTNPVEVTGDGIAMAARVGARLVDMEFVQFHPTTLQTESRSGPRALLTEALRGAGAWLVDEDGRRFMFDVDPAGELAPRDVVAREVYRRRAYLDVRPLGSALHRFRTLLESCQRAGLDPRRTPLPVQTAAHYAMGGVAVSSTGRTSVPGLWACGETASTGLHGANRLASNSLLEALVFGFELGTRLGTPAAKPRRVPVRVRSRTPEQMHDHDVEASRQTVQTLMWDYVGLERDEEGLRFALGELEALASPLAHIQVTSREVGELRNLALVSLLVTSAALEREETRGGHSRKDHPASAPEWDRRLSLRLMPGNASLSERIAHESGRPEPARARAVR